jgi:DNA-binding NtrC family response regulator
MHKCDSLLELVQRFVTVKCIEKKFAFRLPERIVSVPDLILLRASAGHLVRELTAVCKKKWNQVSILALLCPPLERVTEDLPSILTKVDDFLSCPFRDSELFLRVRRLLQAKQMAEGSLESRPASARTQLGSMVGQSEAFLRAIEKVTPLAHAKAPVLISGETGTGKELFARALHYEGPRHGKPFIPVNCGALPDHLFESELFGHIKGAFTDASSAEKGLIAEAEGGTLFLDEIDTLSQPGQIKLLRFLQDGEYRAIGSSRSAFGDVRVVAATNADLMERVKAKAFREDLYYRLNSLSLQVPPLRERLDDIVHLVDYFLNRYAVEHSQTTREISRTALRRLMNYSWPGNIRELEGVITRALVFNPAETLQADDIQLSTSDCGEGTIRFLRAAKSDTINNFERSYLAQLLTEHQGNITHAAKAAGKERRSFQRLLRKHNLDRQLFRV